jgi:bifunctional non-homologous end joining protein LigD
VADDLPALVALANEGELELHAPPAPAEDEQHPTFLVFGLDPGRGADILDCCQVGVWIRGMLRELGLESLVKVSGAGGLHVHVPLGAGATRDDATRFARAVAETLEKQSPAGKVVVDWSQQPAVCVYSLRAGKRPLASAPLRWEEVEAALEAEDRDALVFDHERMMRRVDEEGDLFAPVLALRQELPTL